MVTALALPFWLDKPAREALDIAALADEAAYDELWVGEMATFDAFALAGALARTTVNVRLCVGPLPVTLRDPVALCMGVSSVAELGGRPADLALGASSATVCRQWHGIDSPASATRFSETIDTCRQLFRGERSDIDGETIRSHGFRLRIGHPGTRIAVAAFGPKMLRMATMCADRVVLAQVSPQQIRETRRFMDAMALEVRRPSPQLVVWVQAGYGDAAASQIRRGLVAYLGARGYADMLCAAGFTDVVARARSGATPAELGQIIPRELVELVAAVGDPAQVHQAIQARRQAGADVVVITPSSDSEGGLHRVVTDLARL